VTEREKQETSDKCIQRIREYLKFLGLSDIILNFMLKFESVIGGALIKDFLVPDIPYYPLLIFMPKSTPMQDAVKYINENLDCDHDILLAADFKIVIYDQSRVRRVKATFLHHQFDNIIDSYEKKIMGYF